MRQWPGVLARVVGSTVLGGAVLAVLVVDADLVLSSGGLRMKLVGLLQFSSVLGVAAVVITAHLDGSRLAGLSAAATAAAVLVAATSTGALLIAASAVAAATAAVAVAAWRGALGGIDRSLDAVRLGQERGFGAPMWIWLGAGTFVAAVTLTVLGGWPLGHDESVYALKARSWLHGTPATGYGPYRPPGVPAVGLLVLPFSDEELALRAASTILTLAALGVYAWAVRSWFGGAAAVLAVAVLASSTPWLRRATEFLNDIASTGLTLLFIAVVTRATTSQRSRRPLVGAAVAAAVAFYFRYGVALPIAVAAAMAAVFLGPQLWERRRDVAWATGAFVVVLVPHFVHAVATTGSPLGIVTLARSSVGGEDFGLDTYLNWVPEDLAGPLGGPLIAAGLAWAATRVLVDRQSSRPPAVMPYLATTAVVIVVLLGLETHAEQRFVFTSIALAVALGSHVVVAVIRQLPRGTQHVAWGLTAVAVLASGVAQALDQRAHMAELGEAKRVVVAAANAVAASTDGRCEVITSYSPQITWYSGCATTTNFRPDAIDPQGDDFVVVFDEGKRQPAPGELADLLEQLGGEQIAAIPAAQPHRIGDATVYRLD